MPSRLLAYEQREPAGCCSADDHRHTRRPRFRAPPWRGTHNLFLLTPRNKSKCFYMKEPVNPRGRAIVVSPQTAMQEPGLGRASPIRRVQQPLASPPAAGAQTASPRSLPRRLAAPPLQPKDRESLCALDSPLHPVSRQTSSLGDGGRGGNESIGVGKQVIIIFKTARDHVSGVIKEIDEDFLALQNKD